MSIKKLNSFLCISIFLLLFSSCSNIRYLPEGEKLYIGADVELNPTEKIEDKKEIKKEATQMVRPEPNGKVLGLRVKLWIYNIARTPKRKGLSYWLKNKVGEPPVLYSKVNPVLVTQLIDSRLFNKGIFRPISEYKVEESEKKVKLHYIVTVHAPYIIDSILWPQGDDDLSVHIREIGKKSRIRKGRTYDLDRLNTERERIDEKLKEEGFFYFNPDYILFNADTTSGNKTVKITVTLKEDIPYSALLKYRINEVYVTPDFSLRSDSNSVRKDTILIDDVHYISADKSYRPKTILRSVFLRKGDIYSRTNHNMTLSRLMGMGVFKFVNVRFNEEDTLIPGYLNAHIKLTPLPKKSIRGEIEVVSKSNNFVGPSLTLSYNNRNALKGAELLVINIHGSFETQVNGQYKGLFSYEIGPEINLYVPRFILPFNLKNRKGFYIPKTRFTLGYDFLKRVQYFDLNSFKFIYGYKWKESILKEHELNLVNINYAKLSNESDEFKRMLDVNLLLRKSFEEQFIVGLNYSYTYNQQVIERKPNQSYFNTNIELSGNTISFISKTFLDKNPNPDDPLSVAGAVYSQFLRADADFRYFKRITTTKAKLAGRIYAGAGWAYENSSTLPYIKQFFSGGVSSVRAFRARSLGPGTYIRSDSSSINFFFEQGGDIKLEANAEFRFNIISILKGALFTDAGNIWLLKDNESIPGGRFHVSSFLKELAVGTGFGLRIDANFFVLRFDLAFPIRKPWLPSNERWVFRQIRPFSPDWRGENLLLNIAIGYPF
jgi:outer membrane protein assembly factor BamA